MGPGPTDQDDMTTMSSSSLIEQQRAFDEQLELRKRELEEDVAELQLEVEQEKNRLDSSRGDHVEAIARRRDEMAVSASIFLTYLFRFMVWIVLYYCNKFALII